MQNITTKVCHRKVTKLCATFVPLGDNHTNSIQHFILRFPHSYIKSFDVSIKLFSDSFKTFENTDPGKCFDIPFKYKF